MTVLVFIGCAMERLASSQDRVRIYSKAFVWGRRENFQTNAQGKRGVQEQPMHPHLLPRQLTSTTLVSFISHHMDCSSHTISPISSPVRISNREGVCFYTTPMPLSYLTVIGYYSLIPCSCSTIPNCLKSVLFYF